MMNLILCGPPMCGKSYYGVRTAEQLGCQFIETDMRIEHLHLSQTGLKCSCREIHQKGGDSTFRNLEKQVVADLMIRDQAVISIGGGTLLDIDNAKALKKIGKLVFLKTEFVLLLERLLMKSTCPSTIDPRDVKGSFERVVNQRNETCMKHADVVIETKFKTEKEIIATLCNICRENK